MPGRFFIGREINMNKILRRAAVFAAAALFLGQSFAMAAGLTSMRFHSGSEHDRVVYEFTDMPVYTTATAFAVVSGTTSTKRRVGFLSVRT